MKLSNIKKLHINLIATLYELIHPWNVYYDDLCIFLHKISSISLTEAIWKRAQFQGNAIFHAVMTVNVYMD